MIRGTGLDIIEIRRIAGAIKRQAFVERVFTQQEQAYCNSRGIGRAASYAARFAAKEAVFKGFGTGLSVGTWRDVEIILAAKGQPNISLTGYFGSLAKEKGIQQIFLSLTHSQEYAAAQVILWGDYGYEGCTS
jgi:holo-[acyl-carrier protein] synthase